MCVTVDNGFIGVLDRSQIAVVHECKQKVYKSANISIITNDESAKVDLSKYMENHPFRFDQVRWLSSTVSSDLRIFLAQLLLLLSVTSVQTFYYHSHSYCLGSR